MRRSADIVLIGIVCLVVAVVFDFGPVVFAKLFAALAVIGHLIGLALVAIIFLSVCFILLGPVDFISTLLQLLTLLGSWLVLA